MWTVVSDIDGTLTGDEAALRRLAERLTALRSEGRLHLVLSTGRPFPLVLSGIADEGLPEPDAVVCQVGTEIYLAPLTPDAKPMAAWREKLLGEFDREEADTFFHDIEGLERQPEHLNTDLKTSCYLDHCPDPEAAAAEIRRRAEPYSDRYQVVWSSGRDLDILPASSGKGKAIRFLLEALELQADQVVVAGDTGNDATMFHEFGRGILVANAQPELVDSVRQLGNERTYQARRAFAAGVEEGLAFFGLLDGGSDP